MSARSRYSTFNLHLVFKGPSSDARSLFSLKYGLIVAFFLKIMGYQLFNNP